MKTPTQPRLLTWIRAWTVVLMLLIGTLIATSDSNASDVSLLGGIALQSASPDAAIPGVTMKSKTSIVYGLTADFAFNPAWSFETGAIYGPHQLRTEVDASNYIDFKQNALSIPVVFRYHFSQAFSLGVGGYYALSMGNSTSTTTAGGVTGAETDSGSKGDNGYGLVASAKAQIPLGAKVKFVIDGRYNMGLKSVNGFKFTDIQGLAGILFVL